MQNEPFDYSQYDPELVALVDEFIELEYYHLKGEPYTSNARRSFLIWFSEDPIEKTRDKVAQLKAKSQQKRLNDYHNREAEWKRMWDEAMRLEDIQLIGHVRRF